MTALISGIDNGLTVATTETVEERLLRYRKQHIETIDNINKALEMFKKNPELKEVYDQLRRLGI